MRYADQYSPQSSSPQVLSYTERVEIMDMVFVKGMEDRLTCCEMKALFVIGHSVIQQHGIPVLLKPVAFSNEVIASLLKGEWLSLYSIKGVDYLGLGETYTDYFGGFDSYYQDNAVAFMVGLIKGTKPLTGSEKES